MNQNGTKGHIIKKIDFVNQNVERKKTHNSTK